MAIVKASAQQPRGAAAATSAAGTQGTHGARPRTTQAASRNRPSMSSAIWVWRHTSAHTFCGRDNGREQE